MLVTVSRYIPRIWTTTIATFTCLIIITCLWPFPQQLPPFDHYNRFLSTSKSGSELSSSSSTLGFGIIYVLTEDPSTWRIQGLLQAAKLIGLQLEIPVQPHLPDSYVNAQVGPEALNATDYYPSATRAVLNHLKILEAFSETSYETALILEDDVDFSINIKQQMNLVSKAFWTHANITGLPPSAKEEEEEIAQHPYRDSDWDIFWPGHFGTREVPNRTNVEFFPYKDPYALPWKKLHSYFTNYYKEMARNEILNGTEELQKLGFNVAPLASFAYATTRTHAERLVQDILIGGRNHREKGDPWDVAMHWDCKDQKQRCVAPVPQLFHHHSVVGEKAIKSLNVSEGRQDMEWYRGRHKFTYNIEWSARCNAARVGERLGDRWQCLAGIDDPL